MQVDHHPGANEKCFATQVVECGGGPAANAAVAVARLGGVSAFAGYLGNDLYGDQHFEELVREGIITTGIVRAADPTPLSVILVKPSGARTVVSYRPKKPLNRSTAYLNKLVQLKPEVLLCDGHERNISVELARWAKKENVPVVLDAGSVHQGTRDLIKFTDFLVASYKFSHDFTGETDPRRALVPLSEYAKTVVITIGEQGLVWKTGEFSGAFPAFPVKAVDTTGAGDVFHGAFALGVARRMPLKEILRFASAAAALSCTKMGARIACPSESEVLRFLQNFS